MVINQSFLLYKMKGNNINDPQYSLVYWYSENAPDYTGANSNYPIGSIVNIAIDGQPINQTSSVQFNIPTGPVATGGDVSGIFPGPFTVIGIEGVPVHTTTPTFTEVLTMGNDGYWGPAPVGTIQGITVTFTNPQPYQVLGFADGYIQNINQQSAVSTQTVPIFANTLAVQPALTARETIFTDGYSSQYDGGEGQFVWNSTSTATANGGTIIQVIGVSTGRWMRVYDQNIWVTWFGAKGDGSTDDSAAIQAAINAAGIGGTVYFPRLLPYQSTNQTYVIANKLTLDYYANQLGVTLLGDSPAVGTDGAAQSTIKSIQTTYSGTAASITAVSTSVALSGTFTTTQFSNSIATSVDQTGTIVPGMNITISGSYLVTSVTSTHVFTQGPVNQASGVYTGTITPHFITITGLTGLTSNTNTGDCISLSNTANTDGNGKLINNGNFTISYVNVAANTVTAYGFNPQVDMITGYCTATDSNNGAIHWTIKQHMIWNTTDNLKLQNLCLFAGNNAASCVYATSTQGGEGGNTAMVCDFVTFVGGVHQVNIGDIPLDGAYSTNGVNNSEFFQFYNCYFDTNAYSTFSAVKINGLENKGHIFRDCAMQTQTYGIWLWGGSFAVFNMAHETHTGSCYLAYNPDDTLYINGIEAEHCTRLFVSQLGVNSSGGTTPYNCIIENVRYDCAPSDLAADGFIIHWIYNGGLIIRSGEFSVGSSGFTNMAIGVNGVPNTIDKTLELTGTFTPTTGSKTVITSINQTGLISPGQYITFIGFGSGIYTVSAVGSSTITLSQNYNGTGSGLPSLAYPQPSSGLGSPALVDVQNCYFPNNIPSIVRSTNVQPGYWRSLGNSCNSGSGVNYNLPDGMIPLTTGQLNFQAVPLSIYNLITNTVSQPTTYLMLDGYSLWNNGMSSVELNSGAATNLYGMLMIYLDQVRTFTNLTGNTLTLKHESTSNPTTFQRFHSPTGSDVTFTMSATVRYSSALSRWVITQAQ